MAFERRATRALPLVDRSTGSQRPRGAARWWVAGVLVVVGAFVAAPLVTMVERSLWTGSGHSLDAWRSLRGSLRDSVLFVPPIDAIRSSLSTATLATLLAVPLGIAAALGLAHRGSRWREIGLLLPLGTSAVTVGFGMLLAFGGPPLAIRSEPWLVPVAHAVVALPFVVRTVLPLLRGIDPALREAAAIAGASPARVRRAVDLPVVSRAAAVAGGFAFAISLGEFGATTFLARARNPTIPLLIERLLGQPGVMNVAQAMALSTLLAVLVVAVILVVDRWRTPGSEW
jgi:thiamine transport system permease protein